MVDLGEASDGANRGVGQEGFWYEMNHAEAQRPIWSGGLRIEDARKLLPDLCEASAG